MTRLAATKQEEYARHFKEHAAHFLISTLAKVRHEVLTALLRAESKIYFRALRLPMIITRSYKMYNRKVLRNHLRLCRRLISIDRHVPFYRKTRLLWRVFNVWLQYLEKAKLHPQAGFVRQLKRRLLLFPDYHVLIAKAGFINKEYTEDSRLRKLSAEFGSLFSRWKMYTQESILFGLMHARVGKLRRLQVLRKCFWALKTGLTMEDLDFQRVVAQSEPTCFPIVQLRSDLDQIAKRFLPRRKKVLPQTIKRKNQKVIMKRKVESKDGATFKKFLAEFSAEVSVRVATEQRLLFEAFEQRGVQQYVHRHVPRSRRHRSRNKRNGAKAVTKGATRNGGKSGGKPGRNNDDHSVASDTDTANADDEDLDEEEEERQREQDAALVPAIMAKLDAPIFCDPRVEDMVPSGYRLAKIKLAMLLVGTSINSNTNSNNNNNTNGNNNGANNGGKSNSKTGKSNNDKNNADKNTDTNATTNNNNANNSNTNDDGDPKLQDTSATMQVTTSQVLGWQLLWTAEGCVEIESKARGLWHAAGLSVHEV